MKKRWSQPAHLSRWGQIARTEAAREFGSVFALVTMGFAPALAQTGQSPATQQLGDNQTIVSLTLVVPLVLITTIVSLLHMWSRRQTNLREAALTATISELRARLDRANVFLSAEPQISVAWGSANSEPDIEGDPSLVTEAPVARRVLGFGSWLPPATAQELEGCVNRLRQRGEGFRMAVTSLTGRHLETDGRAVSGHAVLRIRDVSGDRLELSRLRALYTCAKVELNSLKSLLDAVPQAIWLRDKDDKLIWVNAAYSKAVETVDAKDAAERGIELLDRGGRDAARLARQSSQSFRERLHAVVAGERHLLDTIEVPAQIGAAGQALDLSELEQVRSDLVSQMKAHTQTLDRLSTAVAIFDRSRRLAFHNAAYRQLWSLDASFLEHAPTDSEILDRLRAERRLPEQTDFRAWKGNLLATYLTVEPVEQVWHLPDRRTLRVVINPNPRGGVTYL